MPSPEQIDSIHRLHHVENWSLRKIARHLKLNRRPPLDPSAAHAR